MTSIPGPLDKESALDLLVVPAQTARDRWGQLVKGVAGAGSCVVVTHLRKPVAAIVALPDLSLLEGCERKLRARRPKTVASTR